MTTPRKDIHEETTADVTDVMVDVTSHGDTVTDGSIEIKDRVSGAMHVSPPLGPEMITALYDAIAEEEKEWKDRRIKNPIVSFLDSISSIEELAAVRRYCEEHGLLSDFLKPHSIPGPMSKYDHEYDPTCTFDTYRHWLKKWERPEEALPKGLREYHPLLSRKLDTPEKVRMLLRFAEFCDHRLDNISLIAWILEDIIRDHEVCGAKILEFRKPDFYTQCDRLERYRITEIFTYYTQIQASALRRLMFPDLQSSGVHGTTLWLDWSG